METDNNNLWTFYQDQVLTLLVKKLEQTTSPVICVEKVGFNPSSSGVLRTAYLDFPLHGNA